MNEDRFGHRAASLLNRGLALEQSKLARLQQARARALERQRQPQWAFVPAWAGRAFGPLGPLGAPNRLIMPFVFLVMVLIGFQYWHKAQVHDEFEELDAAVLKGDLPIDAYLDSGFQSWLKRSSD
jgi:hypothetical protein